MTEFNSPFGGKPTPKQAPATLQQVHENTLEQLAGALGVEAKNILVATRDSVGNTYVMFNGSADIGHALFRPNGSRFSYAGADTFASVVFANQSPTTLDYVGDAKKPMVLIQMLGQRSKIALNAATLKPLPTKQ